MSNPSIVQANAHKVDQIALAQREGSLNDRFSAATLLEMIAVPAQAGVIVEGTLETEQDYQRRRQGVRDAVQRLIDP